MLFRIAFAIVLPLVSVVSGHDASLKTVTRAFDAANVSVLPTALLSSSLTVCQITRDIQLPFHPKVLFDVTFPEPSGHPTTLHAGIQLPRNGELITRSRLDSNAHSFPLATAGPPTFSIRTRLSFAFGGPFVVAAVDPDAPSGFAEVRHFLGGNFHLVHSRHETKQLVNTTAVISTFQQPGPPPGDSPHRYDLAYT